MNYKIPLFNLNFDEKEELAVLETIRSKWISTGPKTAAFEIKFAEMLNVGYAIALSNCTVALHLALKLIDIKKNDEVICPSLTFVATVNAIRYVDAIPVFSDVKSLNDLTVDPIDIEKKITIRTKAIIVMHYAGFPCDMDAIMHLADKYKLKVIEDASHGPLSEYKSKKLGTIGDIGCFSFFSNKNISIGEGGMLVTNNSDYCEKAMLLRSHGMTSLSYERSKGHSTNYDVIDLGYNYRIDDIRSSIGLVQLEKLHNDLLKRIGIRKEYLRQLEGLDGIIVPFSNNVEFVSNYIMPIILTNSTSEKRDYVRKHLHSDGIQTSIHYPPVHRFSIYQNQNSSLHITNYIADNEITLPMFSKLSPEDIFYIVSAIKSIL